MFTYVWHPSAAATTTYQANANNQYTAIGGQTLSYDANGNLNTDPMAPLGTTIYGLDQRNRLTSAANAQHSAGYTYDPFDRRASKTVGGAWSCRERYGYSNGPGSTGRPFAKSLARGSIL